MSLFCRNTLRFLLQKLKKVCTSKSEIYIFATPLRKIGSLGRVARHRSAKPSTAVRIRQRPLSKFIKPQFLTSWGFIVFVCCRFCCRFVFFPKKIRIERLEICYFEVIVSYAQLEGKVYSLLLRRLLRFVGVLHTLCQNEVETTKNGVSQLADENRSTNHQTGTCRLLRRNDDIFSILKKMLSRGCEISPLGNSLVTACSIQFLFNYLLTKHI